MLVRGYPHMWWKWCAHIGDFRMVDFHGRRGDIMRTGVERQQASPPVLLQQSVPQRLVQRQQPV